MGKGSRVKNHAELVGRRQMASVCAVVQRKRGAASPDGGVARNAALTYLSSGPELEINPRVVAS